MTPRRSDADFADAPNAAMLQASEATEAEKDLTDEQATALMEEHEATLKQIAEHIVSNDPKAPILAKRSAVTALNNTMLGVLTTAPSTGGQLRNRRAAALTTAAKETE